MLIPLFVLCFVGTVLVAVHEYKAKREDELAELENEALDHSKTKGTNRDSEILLEIQKHQQSRQEEKQEILVDIHKETRESWIEEHIQWMNKNYEVLSVELKSYLMNDEITYVACVVFKKRTGGKK